LQILESRFLKQLKLIKKEAKTLTPEQENHMFGAGFAVFNSKKSSTTNE
jgi:hypothetical protein